MSIYWINCFLACTLSYLFGWYMAKRALTQHFAVALERVISSLHSESNNVTKDVKINLH